jgi:hypothetical protein
MSIVETRNLFVNTEETLIGECRNVTINTPQSLLSCDENQYMRLSLNAFSMRKNWYNINKYNNTFYIVGRSSTGTVVSAPFRIPQGNYQSFGDITYGFCAQIDFYLTGVLKQAPFNIVTPNVVCTWNPISNLIELKFDTTGAPANSLTDIKLVSFTIPEYTPSGASLVKTILGNDFIGSFQDNHEIMGGCNHINQDTNSFDELTPLYSVVKSGSAGNPSFTFTGLYNASLSSEENLYLRTDLNSTSYQTSGFDTDANLYPYVVNSQILAKIPIPNPEFTYMQNRTLEYNTAIPPVLQAVYNGDSRYERPFDIIEFTDNGNNIYSIILVAKKMSSMRLFVTDSYGRLIPEISLEQINCNGMNFTASIRIDVFQE